MADNKVEGFFEELFNELESLASGKFWESKSTNAVDGEVVTFKRSANGKRRKPENTFNANPSTEKGNKDKNGLAEPDSRDNESDDSDDETEDTGPVKPDKGEST